MKKLTLIFSIFLLSSCSVPNWYKPYGYQLFKQMPKDGSPGFRLGWVHGCESGLGSQFGTAMYHTFYTWKRDPDITSVNPDFEKIRKRYKKELRSINWNNIDEVKKNFSDYNTVFWGAHAFCRHAVLGILQTAGMTPQLAGDARWEPSGHSIGNVWKINGKGDTRIGWGDSSLW